MAQIARPRTKINTNPTQTGPVHKSRRPVSPGAAGQMRLVGDVQSSSRDSGRVVVEVGWGVVVYPSAGPGGLWRATFTEGGVRRFRQGRSEAELAVRLEKVIERLAAGARPVLAAVPRPCPRGRAAADRGRDRPGARVAAAGPDRRRRCVPPADVLPLIGWDGAVNHGDDYAVVIAAILRSWEQRFGARLLRVGFADIQLLADRPPRTLQAARLLAAEQFAFCDECAGQGLHDVASITDHLLSSPVWTFWWD